MAHARRLRQAARDDDVRARAEAAASGGSPAAALALMTATAEDLGRDDPLEAAVLLAEASWYALVHGPARALQVARRAAELAGDADGRVALIVHGRLGDALQWNGQYAEAQQEWLRAAAETTAPEPHLLATRTDALLRSGISWLRASLRTRLRRVPARRENATAYEMH